MRNRKILISSIIVILTASLLITGIYAYFTYTDFNENRASIGNSEITLIETFENPDIEPNEITTVTKQVNAENTGINPSGVRVRVEFSEKSVLDWVTADYNTQDWEKDGDWWYYKAPLMPQKVTTPLFNKITCNNPTASQVKNFDVYLYAESRSCQSNATTAQIKNLFADD